ncbi:MATE family efflux transporter [Shewanella inventionis]|uniref:MATE family efflux transporter n=1 Tax=Shewanella inventionis TaxID=1738770 RepID=A0ABQ1IV22_9GAMM|nr:MATE family efflux transporter [Shewanella inventionis]MCL1158341.1 MATE family efflux transporter [Shewanella inventionis]GGB51961.1 MATE family efflux transporter [Shewanella inventionis]
MFLPLTSNAYIKRNISLGWPLALNALLMQSMLMIDTLLVSPLGEVSLAAMGIATTIVAFILGIQMALANGTQLVMSRAVGSGNSQKLANSFWSGMLINMLVAVFFWVMLTVLDGDIIQWLTDNANLYNEIAAYLNVAKYLVLFTAITQVITAMFNALGQSKIPFKSYLIELPINACASYILIYGVFDWHGLGVVGAAIGSVIAISLRMVFLTVCLKYKQGLDLSFNSKMALFINNIKLHFVEIFPVAANVTMLSIGATVYQLLYSQLSINAYAAITLLMPWIRGGTQFITSWAHASAITISQAIGSKKLDNLTQDVDISIIMAVVLSVCSCGLFWGLSFVIADIYPGLDPETYLALSAIAPLYILLPFIRGYNTVHGHILRALGKTTAVFKINFTGQWLISIPLCALLILYFDASLFWAFAVMPFEEAVKALPFRYLARKTLSEFDSQTADKLI